MERRRSTLVFAVLTVDLAVGEHVSPLQLMTHIRSHSESLPSIVTHNLPNYDTISPTPECFAFQLLRICSRAYDL
jgi:hypothetical protein